VRDAQARLRDFGLNDIAQFSTMITKTFFLTKEIRAMRTKNLRDNKFFRDHVAPGDRTLTTSLSRIGCFSTRLARWPGRRAAFSTLDGYRKFFDFRWLPEI
jgi:hypothetical protein